MKTNEIMCFSNKTHLSLITLQPLALNQYFSWRPWRNHLHNMLNTSLTNAQVSHQFGFGFRNLHFLKYFWFWFWLFKHWTESSVSKFLGRNDGAFFHSLLVLYLYLFNSTWKVKCMIRSVCYQINLIGTFLDNLKKGLLHRCSELSLL